MIDTLISSERLLLAIATCCYCTAFFVGLIALLLRKNYPKLPVFTLTVSGFAFQTIGMNLRALEVKGCPLGNFFEITHFICWSLILIYFIIVPIIRLRLLGFFVAGLTASLCSIALAIPSWDTTYTPGLFGGNPWIELHATLAIFSYSLFAAVALVSVMFLIQRHGLKEKQFRGIYQHLPSVQKLEIVARRLLIVGLSCLTAALAFGALFYFGNSHPVPVFKLTATCLVWCGYLCVTLLQIKGKLATRRHAIVSILLFILSLLSLWPVQNARIIEEQQPDRQSETLVH